MEYNTTIRYTVDADSPQEAAQKTYQLLMGKGSWRPIILVEEFGVSLSDKQWFVDLETNEMWEHKDK